FFELVDAVERTAAAVYPGRTAERFLPLAPCRTGVGRLRTNRVPVPHAAHPPASMIPTHLSPAEQAPAERVEPTRARHRPLAGRALSLFGVLLAGVLGTGCDRSGSRAQALSMAPEARVARLVDILT